MLWLLTCLLVNTPTHPLCSVKIVSFIYCVYWFPYLYKLSHHYYFVKPPAGHGFLLWQQILCLQKCQVFSDSWTKLQFCIRVNSVGHHLITCQWNLTGFMHSNGTYGLKGHCQIFICICRRCVANLNKWDNKKYVWPSEYLQCFFLPILLKLNTWPVKIHCSHFKLHIVVIAHWQVLYLKVYIV